MIGKVVGSYKIVEKIGEGGMGAVYRAVDVMLEREAAIKAIRPDLAREPQIVERFRAEARTLARLHHPAIAMIYSFFHDGG
ncbi:MAG TPA: protein kinase, partial [Thermoanaerobaculia bacterium]|nr:protein kinase [Thermoanaerobaculia bacterium]